MARHNAVKTQSRESSFPLPSNHTMDSAAWQTTELSEGQGKDWRARNQTTTYFTDREAVRQNLMCYTNFIDYHLDVWSGLKHHVVITGTISSQEYHTCPSKLPTLYRATKWYRHTVWALHPIQSRANSRGPLVACRKRSVQESILQEWREALTCP